VNHADKVFDSASRFYKHCDEVDISPVVRMCMCCFLLLLRVNSKVLARADEVQCRVYYQDILEANGNGGVNSSLFTVNWGWVANSVFVEDGC